MESSRTSSDGAGNAVPRRRLKIIVCKPRIPRQSVDSFPILCCEPLEMEYLDTVLSEHDVVLVDETADRANAVRIARRVTPDVVLLTGYVPHVDGIHSLARRLKRLPAPPLVFVGGPHAEVVPGHFTDAHVDGVFFADSLRGIVHAMDCIARGRDYTHTPGAIFMKAGVLVRNPAPPTDAASLPIPRRRMLSAHPRRYRFMHYAPCAMIKTSLGCAGRCTFCFCRELNGGQVSSRPMNPVMDEIQTIPTETVFIADDNFLASPARAREFCRQVKERGISKRFIVYGTADRIAADPDLIGELKDAGLTGIIVGFEFVTDDALASVQKSASLRDNDRAVQVCAESDIDLFALFMLDPDWPPSEFRRVSEYVRSRAIGFATFATLVALPGTAMCSASGDVDAVPAWRYDLLHVTRKPRHMTTYGYYARLCRMTALPRRDRSVFRRMVAKVGFLRAAETVLAAWRVGFQYVFKLLVWP